MIEKPRDEVSVVPKEKPRYGQNMPSGDIPDILKKIRWCESKNQQFNPDGSVHRGVINPQDVGWFQVKEYYHLEASKKLGIDIYTKEGNLTYALRLYAQNGTRDWNWSKWCWNDQTVSTSTWEMRFKQNM